MNKKIDEQSKAQTQQPEISEKQTGETSQPQTVKKCINCGQNLIRRNRAWFCPKCNPASLEYTDIFKDDEDNDADYVFIDCPGATLYEPGTDKVIAGVKFIDDNDPSKGYEIVKEAVYAPTHTKRRRIKREALGKIRRCQGCQDYTVRMRRREGPDFFIPSYKHPNRKKLKSVTPSTTP